MDRLSNVLTIFSVGLILVVLSSVRRSHIRVEYSVSWLGAGIMMLILSRSQSLMQWLARLLGIGDPPLALLLAIFVVFLLVFYRFSVTVSTLKDDNIALAQRLAILEFHLRAQHESREA
ncbi:MAG TPA: DUF2304 domain-containing protein [Bryobacteraceae bacterium]|nr:DUF2304 domain-containing protein [Bryobacteraceae bacterium]